MKRNKTLTETVAAVVADAFTGNEMPHEIAETQPVAETQPASVAVAVETKEPRMSNEIVGGIALAIPSGDIGRRELFNALAREIAAKGHAVRTFDTETEARRAASSAKQCLAVRGVVNLKIRRKNETISFERKS